MLYNHNNILYFIPVEPKPFPPRSDTKLLKSFSEISSISGNERGTQIN
jgi:hypothetical protein